MPELPDVAALAAFLDDALAGKELDGLVVASFTALKTVSPPVSALAGAELTGVGRRGKLLIFRTDGPVLAVHLYRAGWVRWYDKAPVTLPKPGKGPIVARMTAAGTGLDFTEAGTQRRLALWLGATETDLEPLANLGPDALELARDSAAFAAASGTARAQVKRWLTDQHVHAGIGNGFSDDIAHAARLSPFASVATLADDARERLRTATIDILEGATAALTGLPPAKIKDAKKAWYRVHDRQGQPCPVCGTTIASVTFSDSSLQYCPGCQTGGRRLADRTTSRFLK